MNAPTLQSPPRAPGRGDGPAAAPEAPAKGAPAEGTPDAPPGAPPGGGGLFGSSGMLIVMMVVMFGMMWFMSRSEKKRRTELESKLKKGDRVVTGAGLIGKLVELGEAQVRVEIAPGVVVAMTKASIQGLADGDSTSAQGRQGRR